METQHVTLDREKARELYQAYKKHQHYSQPIDYEVQRTYQLLAQGKVASALGLSHTMSLWTKKLAGLKTQLMSSAEKFCGEARPRHDRKNRI